MISPEVFSPPGPRSVDGDDHVVVPPALPLASFPPATPGLERTLTPLTPHSPVFAFPAFSSGLQNCFQASRPENPVLQAPRPRGRAKPFPVFVHESGEISFILKVNGRHVFTAPQPPDLMLASRRAPPAARKVKPKATTGVSRRGRREKTSGPIQVRKRQIPGARRGKSVPASSTLARDHDPFPVGGVNEGPLETSTPLPPSSPTFSSILALINNEEDHIEDIEGYFFGKYDFPGPEAVLKIHENSTPFEDCRLSPSSSTPFWDIEEGYSDDALERELSWNKLLRDSCVTGTTSEATGDRVPEATCNLELGGTTPVAQSPQFPSTSEWLSDENVPLPIGFGTDTITGPNSDGDSSVKINPIRPIAQYPVAVMQQQHVPGYGVPPLSAPESKFSGSSVLHQPDGAFRPTAAVSDSLSTLPAAVEDERVRRLQVLPQSPVNVDAPLGFEDPVPPVCGTPLLNAVSEKLEKYLEQVNKQKQKPNPKPRTRKQRRRVYEPTHQPDQLDSEGPIAFSHEDHSRMAQLFEIYAARDVRAKRNIPRARNGNPKNPRQKNVSEVNNEGKSEESDPLTPRSGRARKDASEPERSAHKQSHRVSNPQRNLRDSDNASEERDAKMCHHSDLPTGHKRVAADTESDPERQGDIDKESEAEVPDDSDVETIRGRTLEHIGTCQAEGDHKGSEAARKSNSDHERDDNCDPETGLPIQSKTLDSATGFQKTLSRTEHPPAADSADFRRSRRHTGPHKRESNSKRVRRATDPDVSTDRWRHPDPARRIIELEGALSAVTSVHLPKMSHRKQPPSRSEHESSASSVKRVSRQQNKTSSTRPEAMTASSSVALADPPRYRGRRQKLLTEQEKEVIWQKLEEIEKMILASDDEEEVSAPPQFEDVFPTPEDFVTKKFYVNHPGDPNAEYVPITVPDLMMFYDDEADRFDYKAFDAYVGRDPPQPRTHIPHDARTIVARGHSPDSCGMERTETERACSNGALRLAREIGRLKRLEEERRGAGVSLKRTQTVTRERAHKACESVRMGGEGSFIETAKMERDRVDGERNTRAVGLEGNEMVETGEEHRTIGTVRSVGEYSKGGHTNPDERNRKRYTDGFRSDNHARMEGERSLKRRRLEVHKRDLAGDRSGQLERKNGKVRQRSESERTNENLRTGSGHRDMDTKEIDQRNGSVNIRGESSARRSKMEKRPRSGIVCKTSERLVSMKDVMEQEPSNGSSFLQDGTNEGDIRLGEPSNGGRQKKRVQKDRSVKRGTESRRKPPVGTKNKPRKRVKEGEWGQTSPGVGEESPPKEVVYGKRTRVEDFDESLRRKLEEAMARIWDPNPSMEVQDGSAQ